jgi:hypothetical protein
VEYTKRHQEDWGSTDFAPICSPAVVGEIEVDRVKEKEERASRGASFQWAQLLFTLFIAPLVAFTSSSLSSFFLLVRLTLHLRFYQLRSPRYSSISEFPSSHPDFIFPPLLPANLCCLLICRLRPAGLTLPGGSARLGLRSSFSWSFDHRAKNREEGTSILFWKPYQSDPTSCSPVGAENFQTLVDLVDH